MHRASPRVPASVILAALLAASGCGGGGDPKKQIDTVSSWTATMQLARNDRQRRRTTKLHATELRDLARSALEDSRRSLAAHAMTADARRRSKAALDSLQGAIGDMDHELLLP